MTGIPARLASALVIALWAAALPGILLDAADAALAPASSAALACLVVLAMALGAGWHTRLLCGALAAAAALLAGVYGHWEGIIDGFGRAAIFAPFLATVLLLRATAEERPEVAEARRLFGALDPGRRDSAVVIGTHLLGSVLQVGVFAVLAPILGPRSPHRREVFLVAVRGMALVPLWSPFVVGMAVASQYLPQVPLWQVMALGLALTAASVAVSVAVFDRRGSLRDLAAALAALAPVVPPVAVAALIVVATTAATGLSTIESLVIGLPVPCLLALAAGRPGAARRTLARTAGGLHGIGPEISILTLATALGAVFEAALPDTGLLAWLAGMELAPAAVIATVVLAMNLSGLAGVHPIVSGTAILVVFTGVPTGVADLVLMQALLVGWGLATCISVGSLSIATGASLFGIAPTRLITARNIAFAFSASAVAIVALVALNRLL